MLRVRHDGVAVMREDASKFLPVGVMEVGAGLEVYGHVWPEMRAMGGGEVMAEVVAAVCLRRRASSLRRAAAERFPLRTIDRSLCANCSLACSLG